MELNWHLISSCYLQILVYMLYYTLQHGKQTMSEDTIGKIIELSIAQKTDLRNSFAAMSIHELQARLAMLQQMAHNEKLCRRKMVQQQPENWGKITRMAWPDLQNMCRVAINNISIEIEQRFESTSPESA